MAHDDTRTFQEKLVRRKKSKPIAAVLVAHSPKWGQDRAAVNESITIGRDDDCELTIEDINTSRRHTRIVSKGKKHWISDLGSKNGTHVNGSQIRDSVKIEDGAIIRIGNTILVFVKDARGMLDTRAERHRLIAGSFHSAEIVRKLANCSRMGHNILLAGPSGCGKEVAARAFAELLRRPLEVQNAARYSSEEEATSTLFGVGKKVFSNVDERQGFIEKADGGIFFLDEAHNLPRRVQKSLLRVVEDGKIGRIGETDSKEVDV
ncbi:MAG: FHA domain-containing protein, partial [Proteobacteria bacterium]|nr:FHA domain-containing protein [Pseudomonadota bacterium]